MHFTKKSSSEIREEFKKKLKDSKILKFPGSYNPLTAKLIEDISFDGVYISGAVMANDLGIPDIGLTTLKEVSYRANQISRVTDLPSIVDADTGFGNCKKTIETFENLGLSGCHIEDQVDQKRCGHLDNKKIISKEDMIKKINISVKARKDNNFLIIARTDANSVEGMQKTIERIKAYEDACADIIFPEAMKDKKEF
jgi:methylisocitrate lyase